MNRLLLLIALLMTASPAFAENVQSAQVAAECTGYDDFLAAFERFEATRLPEPWNANFAENDAPRATFSAYAPAEIAKRLETLKSLNAELDELAVKDWERELQSEYLAVRSLVDGEEFRLSVSRPWARDPGFYVDMLQRIAFADLPAEGKALDGLRKELAAVPEIVGAAKSMLDDVARDYALLAIRNLTIADGVGHGHPYRMLPPPGVIGWFDDLLSRARSRQPALADEVQAASEAVADYLAFLEERLPSYTAEAGVGAARYDWYLRHVKLLPYTGDQLIILGEAEWDRTMAAYALAQHKDRATPALNPAASADDYKRRIAATDRNIRKFLVREDVLTIPDYIETLDTNAPFIERPGGPNFWEAVQFRDPHPDHLHAVIPGHRFDGVIEEHNKHPIRGHISDGVRAEGWGVYLEESMMQAGLLGKRRRVAEMIYLFGVFRAARIAADVGMQRNEITVDDAISLMRQKTPWLDENVARVDAEIYLRRPPGYGVGYTIGALQMRALLGDRKNELREDFALKDFHDDFLSRGRLPITLLRWEMTGLDDEVRNFWDREPIPED